MNAIFTSFFVQSPIILWGLVCGCALVIEDGLATSCFRLSRNTLTNIVNGLVVCVSIFFIIPAVSFLLLITTRDAGLGLIDLQSLFPFGVKTEIFASLLFLFIGDLCFYLWHRAEHTIPFLWDMHAVHHSDKEMNASTYLRQHWLEAPAQKILINVPVALMFKFTPLEMQIVTYGATFMVFFTHMNVRWGFGKLSWSLTSPQLHRLHHSALRRHWNSNYAQIFPIIDKIFGTYVAPRKKEYPPTGLLGKERIETLPDTLFWPFKRWIERLRVCISGRNWRYKIFPQ